MTMTWDDAEFKRRARKACGCDGCEGRASDPVEPCSYDRILALAREAAAMGAEACAETVRYESRLARQDCRRLAARFREGGE